MINQVEYAWENIEVVQLGRPLVRILEIEYDTERDGKHVRGRGSSPLGTNPGNKTPKASYSIGQSELEAMIRYAQSIKPGGDITDLVFDINVAYRVDDEIVRDRIVGFRPGKQPKGMKNGDTEMAVKITGICTKILYNI